uniref:AlNc14C78G5165 protein n=1 Tax=Albugo laibachii Nc14 TaxID=890382 RepID=F0WEW7_9STRA|nr:AlNc14C78G5165 [Albugo laibachii Nc14]|eukprot:CCA19749.1 AlNc14C78G5165 [Albugo laibachii Nc14]
MLQIAPSFGSDIETAHSIHAVNEPQTKRMRAVFHHISHARRKFGLMRSRSESPLSPVARTQPSSRLTRQSTSRMSRIGITFGKNKSKKCVHFDFSHEEIERSMTSEEEKKSYHYSRKELDHVMARAREDGACTMMGSTLFQPAGTILQQGSLTFPSGRPFLKHSGFLTRKTFYCLLLSNCEFLLFRSAADAARREECIARFKMQSLKECSAMTISQKLALSDYESPIAAPTAFYLDLVQLHSTSEVRMPRRVLIVTRDQITARNWILALTKAQQIHLATLGKDGVIKS